MSAVLVDPKNQYKSCKYYDYFELVKPGATKKSSSCCGARSRSGEIKRVCTLLKKDVNVEVCGKCDKWEKKE
jgi:hypothetical protein